MLKSILALLIVAVPGTQDAEEGRIKECLEALMKAMAAKDSAAVGKCFHAQRMLQEFVARGVPFDKADEKAAQQLLQAMSSKFGQGLTLMGIAWEKIRLLRVKPNPDGSEVEAFCRLTVTGGGRSRVRFWLVKDGDAWKIYDVETQEENMRLSVTMGSLYAALAADEATQRGTRLAFVSLQKAMKLLGEGEAEEAHKNLRQAIEAGPPAIMCAWIEMLDTNALAALGRYEDAIQAADRALKLNKDMVVLHHLKAGAYFELEEYEKCIESEKEFINGVGDDADGWEVIGNAYDRLKKPEEAIAAYRKGAACDDEDHANRMSLGRLLLDAGKPAEAGPVLLQAVRNAKDIGVFEEAAELLDEKGAPEGLLALAEDEAKRSPDEVSPGRWQGRALRKLKRFEESEKVLRAALEKDKEDADCQEDLVLTLAHAGKEKEAIERVEAIERETGGRSWFLRAVVHALADRQAQAVEELSKAVDTEEDAESMLDVYEREPVFRKTRERAEYKAVVERAKSRAEYSRAAGGRIEKEDWEGLLKLAKERSAAVPDHAHAHYHQGQALRRMGRHLDAELALKAAVAKAKDRVTYQEELGKALAAQGRLDEALALADALVADADHKHSGLFLRVAVYAMVKKSAPALKALEELLKDQSYWHWKVENDDDLEEFRKLQGVQELLKKAKAKSEEE